eukprot:CAMPEP_0201731412 /NCGR_PEP_ID=MMETSP0593-20130828/25622_1 /ASSEMBLY_ACC=CAM_ASM_000672 /TAXON_ID=267983 /ORGANISM="Skeletonema japonicum, Strain CCMP2506" /LENGTH=553 /DNA_ID=CAMNT_0048224179 /DNA_START=60 /DNA_END=1721 /DNA_ORIENTATION=+
MEEREYQSATNSHHGSIMIDNEEQPQASASFLQKIPEPIKLIAASFLVAILLHHFFFKDNKRSSSSSRLLHGSNDGADGGNLLGSVDHPLIEEHEDYGDEDANSSSASEEVPEVVPSHQSLPQTTRCVEAKVKKRKKQIQPAKKASANRNYDKLICNKTEGDDIEPTATEDVNVTSSPLDQENPSTEPENQQEEQSPPPIQLHSQATHPGLFAYYNWHATITSLYRIYSIPSRDIFTNTFHPAILPMHPSSERGNIAINITVVNQTRYESIQVYWIDYKGNELYKGNIPRGGRWVQTTFIGHPWTFRVNGSGGSDTDGGEEGVLLKYVPFRITPTVLGAKTTTTGEGGVDNYNGLPRVGSQLFTLRDVPEGYVTRNEGYEPACWVDDTILPEPPLIDIYKNGERNLNLFTSHEIQMAIQWSCFQIQREDASSPGTGIAAAKRLLKYLENICLHPEDAKYRKLRVGNRIFFESVYSTGARGVLLALGFEEIMGYLENGPSEGALNYERLRQISDAMMVVDKTLKLMVEGEGVEQPEGSDGYGRAGFGYAGQLNL